MHIIQELKIDEVKILIIIVIMILDDNLCTRLTKY